MSPTVTPEVEAALAKHLDALFSANEIPVGRFGAPAVNFAAVLKRAMALYPQILADYQAIHGLIPANVTGVVDPVLKVVDASVAAALAVEHALGK